MEIIGIGTDIIEIERFKTVNEAFMQRCFTKRERERFKNIENIAGCFAAKEAVVKALGTGFSNFRPSNVEIVHNEAGKPEVTLYASAAKTAETAKIKKIMLSISHCKTYATATAIAQS